MAAAAPTLRTRARRTARTVSRTVGKATAGLRLTPAYLVVGAQRSGTTSMSKALGQHPNVVPAVFHKGVHYFDTAYDRGLEWYLGHFPTRVGAALKARTPGPVITGESSPYYLFHPAVGERIARDLPGARLIVVLRDPVERAYSAYTHEKARGWESESFPRALELEQERIAGEHDRLLRDPSYASLTFQHNAYVTRGQYVEQLERLSRQVGRGRLLVVDSHDFFADPEATWPQVERFLDLPHAGGMVFERNNARPRTAMDEDVRRRLSEHFLPWDERLATWWGRTPSWRR